MPLDHPILRTPEILCTIPTRRATTTRTRNRPLLRHSTSRRNPTMERTHQQPRSDIYSSPPTYTSPTIEPTKYINSFENPHATSPRTPKLPPTTLRTPLPHAIALSSLPVPQQPPYTPRGCGPHPHHLSQLGSLLCEQQPGIGCDT